MAKFTKELIKSSFMKLLEERPSAVVRNEKRADRGNGLPLREKLMRNSDIFRHSNNK